MNDIINLQNEYMKNKRCIILTVIPKTSEISNCKTLTNAKEHDPKTERIIPVVTKCDIDMND